MIFYHEQSNTLITITVVTNSWFKRTKYLKFYGPKYLLFRFSVKIKFAKSFKITVIQGNEKQKLIFS